MHHFALHPQKSLLLFPEQALYWFFYLFFLILQCVESVLAGADLDDIAYVVDEYLAVADVAGVKDLLDCCYKSVDRNLGDYDVNLDFRQEACLDRCATEECLVAFLDTVAEDVGYGHTGYAD